MSRIVTTDETKSVTAHEVINTNDVRRLENMDLIPDELGGNRYLCNGNMIDFAHAGEWSGQQGEN
ncbi:MAG: hypothetical protein Q4C91_06155 [Eubacteriales bacterium]|nr:hypothetical protein [Eubacteriales bacterium]